jgi:hypothetical protein
MSYADIAALDADEQWQVRVAACSFEQAQIFINDGRPDIATLATAVLTSGKPPDTLRQYISFAPGFGDQFAAGGQEAIPDGDILAATQAAWPTVAALLYPGLT